MTWSVVKMKNERDALEIAKHEARSFLSLLEAYGPFMERDAELTIERISTEAERLHAAGRALAYHAREFQRSKH